MHHKLTITLDEPIYRGLRKTVGPGRISRFIENLVRPFVAKKDLDAAYEEMSRDELREKAAETWCENLTETGDDLSW